LQNPFLFTEILAGKPACFPAMSLKIFYDKRIDCLGSKISVDTLKFPSFSPIFSATQMLPPLRVG